MTRATTERVGRALLDRWSAKDVDGVRALLHPEARVAGPLAPGGHIEGAHRIGAFLESENRDPASLPREHREEYERMASARARVHRVVVDGVVAAFECELLHDTGVMAAAVFVEVRDELVQRVSIYLRPPA